jgi:hypothetical protein
LIEHLSAQLALVETASIALQKFEEQPEIGAICASLEHAVSMLASAHERVEHYLAACARVRARHAARAS